MLVWAQHDQSERRSRPDTAAAHSDGAISSARPRTARTAPSTPCSLLTRSGGRAIERTHYVDDHARAQTPPALPLLGLARGERRLLTYGDRQQVTACGFDTRRPCGCPCRIVDARPPRSSRNNGTGAPQTASAGRPRLPHPATVMSWAKVARPTDELLALCTRTSRTCSPVRQARRPVTVRKP